MVWLKTFAAENNDERINRGAYEHEAAKQHSNAHLFFRQQRVETSRALLCNGAHDQSPSSLARDFSIRIGEISKKIDAGSMQTWQAIGIFHQPLSRRGRVSDGRTYVRTSDNFG
jgi:hypothetical protein